MMIGSKEMDDVLLEVAKKAIADKLDGTQSIDKEALLAQYPRLSDHRATFVTLNERGMLRGCIGSLVAHRSLLDDIIANAKAAAFSDPRFPPLSRSELVSIDLEVSLLSLPETLEYSSVEELRSIVKSGEDGIVLRLNGRQATFLPQVWEQLPSFELFFEHLCQKAGLSGNCLQKHPEIQRYHVEKIS